jgi:hypothetical protein
VLFLDLGFEDAVKFLVFGPNLALVGREVVAPTYSSKRPFVERLRKGAIG